MVMKEEHNSCEICGHDSMWHRDGGCQAYRCKVLKRHPPHEFIKEE